jgi:hypothetical protein
MLRFCKIQSQFFSEIYNSLYVISYNLTIRLVINISHKSSRYSLAMRDTIKEYKQGTILKVDIPSLTDRFA